MATLYRGGHCEVFKKVKCMDQCIVLMKNPDCHREVTVVGKWPLVEGLGE